MLGYYGGNHSEACVGLVHRKGQNYNVGVGDTVDGVEDSGEGVRARAVVQRPRKRLIPEAIATWSATEIA